LLAGLHLLAHPLHNALHSNSIDHLPPSATFSSAWICHCDWQVQITAEVTDAEMPGAKVHETKELDIEELDALVLASMELGKVPNTMESDAGSEV
jgi:hypothetical protein